MVSIKATTAPVSTETVPGAARRDVQMMLNQVTLSVMMDQTASSTHHAGCAYSAIQKKRLSVRFPSLRPSADSKTHFESPVVVSTSFHQRSPTSRRPAMFLR